MPRLFLAFACLALLILVTLADKEYEEHSHDHHHHHDHDGRKFNFVEKSFYIWIKLFLDDHHDHESHKKLFTGMWTSFKTEIGKIKF